MTERIIDISDEPAQLHVRYDNLVVEVDGKERYSVPLPELGVLVTSNPRISYTHSVLSCLAESGGVLVVCDGRHLPCAMQVPLHANYVQSERFAKQASASLPTRKRLWQQLVKAKIRAQARALQELRGDDHGLIGLVSKVRSGDPANVEARAARRYWPLLFENEDFRRHGEPEGPNIALNYGYAVLRAIAARAICAAGLHPSLGLHHHNRYDAFCLASDMMEPMRPAVDAVVARMTDEKGDALELDRETKSILLESLTGRFYLKGEKRTMFDILSIMASSLVGVYSGEAKNAVMPEVV